MPNTDKLSERLHSLVEGIKVDHIKEVEKLEAEVERLRGSYKDEYNRGYRHGAAHPNTPPKPVVWVRRMERETDGDISWWAVLPSGERKRTKCVVCGDVSAEEAIRETKEWFIEAHGFEVEVRVWEPEQEECKDCEGDGVPEWSPSDQQMFPGKCPACGSEYKHKEADDAE